MSLPQRPKKWFFMPGKLVRQAIVNRQACPLVTDCYLCRTTRDSRKRYLNNPCVWAQGGESESKGGCLPQKLATEQGMEILSVCPDQHQYKHKQYCYKVKECAECMASIDNRTGLLSPCVWVDDYENHCLPRLYTYHHEIPPSRHCSRPSDPEEGGEDPLLTVEIPFTREQVIKEKEDL